ncbi:MAG: hypothetical protein LBH37_01210 [Oscillospiraceae bacterium]|jgi:hypothetical protein|nr:hypothetical protein [Oscillospiraceae bacterium]
MKIANVKSIKKKRRILFVLMFLFLFFLLGSGLIIADANTRLVGFGEEPFFLEIFSQISDNGGFQLNFLEGDYYVDCSLCYQFYENFMENFINIMNDATSPIFELLKSIEKLGLMPSDSSN